MSKNYIPCNKGGLPNSDRCCCNCQNQIALYKHPWNDINKGACNEPAGLYACVVEHDMDKNYKGIVFEYQHGCCELHIYKEFLK